MQTNLNLSRSARTKLEVLAELYGTLRTAAEIAIDRLYTQVYGQPTQQTQLPPPQTNQED